MLVVPAYAQNSKPVAKVGAVRTAKKTVAKPNIAVQARRFAQLRDYLGFRIFVRKAYSMPLRYVEWYDIKNLVTAFSSRSGFDLIPFWNARNSGGKSETDFTLDKVDSAMLAGRFQEAFTEAQKAAQKIKSLERTRYDARWQLPYIYQSMARALYGARRYDESLTVYQWISPNYPFFRQVLFEKMWAAFKAGRADLALGAIASQRSVYFSKFLSPETYLIQTYIYKRLCREQDLQEVISEMKAYEALISKGDVKDWVATDANTLTLWQLSELKSKLTDDVRTITSEERKREQAEIKEALNQAYQRQKVKILKDLKTALAYAHLAKVTDTKDVLKPIRALTGRDDLLKQDLEVWPAESSEEWTDELGKHVLIGDSKCVAPAASPSN
jgi:tetratricopeptide (TPR) repeat protein